MNNRDSNCKARRRFLTRISRYAAAYGRCAVAGLFVACAGSSETASVPAVDGGPSPEVLEYMNEILLLAERHSINRAKLDWSFVRTEVLAATGSAASIEAADPAIVRLLELLDDGHSLYQSARRQRISVYQPCRHFSAQKNNIPDNIGYIRVGTYLSGPGRPEEYAQELQDQIRLADRPGLVGWIVDLRDNSGGDMWAMVLGVGPLLGVGTAGYFTDPDGSQQEWGYASGAGTLAGQRMWELSSSYVLTPTASAARIAVVTSRATVSAGEAIAIAFRGRPNARAFGEPTCGRSTVNRAFQLSDRAWLFLNTGILTDRDQTSYGGPIVPDEVIPAEHAIERAIAWLTAPQP